ncbi:MAG: lasso RiPP family leader peptide-containing protein [Gemmatimonadota bacterium]|nr:lasso RiPP family leader peptide-containing protein [Gemmatimonadota bacterium]
MPKNAWEPKSAAANAADPPLPAPPGPERLRYVAPTLARYGEVNELTRTVGTKGRRDGRRSARRTGY